MRAEQGSQNWPLHARLLFQLPVSVRHGSDSKASGASALGSDTAEPTAQVHAVTRECHPTDIRAARFAEALTASDTRCLPAALPACIGVALRPPHLTKSSFSQAHCARITRGTDPKRSIFQ